MIAFAAVSVPMRSGLTEKAGKIAPVTEASTGAGAVSLGRRGRRTRVPDVDSLGRCQRRGVYFNLKTELEYFCDSPDKIVAAELSKTQMRAQILGFPLDPASAVISNGHYHHPAAFLEPEDVCGMIYLLAADLNARPRRRP